MFTVLILFRWSGDMVKLQGPLEVRSPPNQPDPELVYGSPQGTIPAVACPLYHLLQMKLTPLPWNGGKHCTSGRFEAFIGIGDEEFDPARALYL